MICTFWEARPGGPRQSCGSPEVVVRRGVRCPNGCLGEGAFDYACSQHRWLLESNDRPFECIHCEAADLEMFPLQEVAA